MRRALNPCAPAPVARVAQVWRSPNMVRPIAMVLFAFIVAAFASPPPTVAVLDPPEVTIEVDVAVDERTNQPFTGTLTSRYYYSSGRPRTPKGKVLHTIINKWVEGLKEGIEREISGTGDLVRETSFSQGRKDGLETVYKPGFGAERYTLMYSNDLKHGTSRGYNSQAKLIWQTEFERDIAKPYSYETNYVTYRDVVHRAGLKFLRRSPDTLFSGYMVLFHPNGAFYYRWAYEDGLPNGLWTMYFPTGELELMEEWRLGQRHGISLSWYHPNQLFERAIYDRGRKIASFKFDFSGGLLDSVVVVEPDGATNGSQPVRSETNRTSSAAGSRR